MDRNINLGIESFFLHKNVPTKIFLPKKVHQKISNQKFLRLPVTDIPEYPPPHNPWYFDSIDAFKGIPKLTILDWPIISCLLLYCILNCCFLKVSFKASVFYVVYYKNYTDICFFICNSHFKFITHLLIGKMHNNIILGFKLSSSSCMPESH